MNRPDFITDEDIERWTKNIENDPEMPKDIFSIPILKEVCFAGIWLAESLSKLGCDAADIPQLQFNAGRYAFGRDVWQAHQDFLEAWKKKYLTNADA